VLHPAVVTAIIDRVFEALQRFDTSRASCPETLSIATPLARPEVAIAVPITLRMVITRVLAFTMW
jgi:hypothetical protein